MVSRLNNWRSRLAIEMDSRRQLPFSWGENDCLLGLARGVIIAITGEDPTDGHGVAYSTEAEALELLHLKGFRSLSEMLSAFLPEKALLMADVGDLAVIAVPDSPIGEALAVFDTSSLIVMSDTGHGRLPRSRAVRAFAVG